LNSQTVVKAMQRPGWMTSTRRMPVLWWSRGGAGMISSGPPGEKGKGVAKIAFGSIR
jgi:hypothetical protein